MKLQVVHIRWIGVGSILLGSMAWVFITNSNTYRGRYFGEPLPTLTTAELARHEKGFQLFIRVWKPMEGLGPLVNARSCATCHHIPVVGGTETGLDKFVIHSTVTSENRDDTFARYQVNPHGEFMERTLPNEFTLRKTQPLYGIGLLESIPISDLLRLADPNDENNDGISGRLPSIGADFGRFGWKSNFASVREFVSFAMTAELGLTNSEYVSNDSVNESYEVTEAQLADMSYFISHLAAPPASVPDNLGGKLFKKAGCTACHVQQFRTSNSLDSSLHNLMIEPYSDLLLHNIGKDGEEFRTPPLWGVNSNGPPYLHDGSANTIREAIMQHHHEGKKSRILFERLEPVAQEHLILFVKSL